LKGDAAGPQVLKSGLHKFTDEENWMQSIAADDVATALAAVAVGTPVNRIVELAGPEHRRMNSSDAS